MNTTAKIILHLALIFGITALLILCIVYPFLPGAYDALSIGLSTIAQIFGAIGLLLVPIGGLWFIYEWWKQSRRKQNHPTKTRRFYFALVSVIVATLIAIILSIVAVVTIGLSLGILSLALWIYTISRLIPKLKVMKSAESESFNPIPLYMIFIPIAVLVSQIMLAAPITEFSRNHTMANSAEFIDDIEAFYTANGYYPTSLLAVWNDYYPNTVAVQRYYYEPNGDAYNLVFEQPRFLFDNIGTREFVVYNKLDEHRMISHNSWILVLGPTAIQTTQGWFAVNDTPSANWKYFWFD